MPTSAMSADQPRRRIFQEECRALKKPSRSFKAILKEAFYGD
jgi:hypothetical protein